MPHVLSTYQRRFDSLIKKHLPQQSQPIGQVYQALQYSFSAGGKRLRPALAYALAESLSIPLEKIDALALAVEYIHTYSLIHDDLPAMDDDDFRRGRPACHKQFDEATAILTGDALNTLAFEVLSQNDDGTPAKQRLQQIYILAQRAGIAGMVGGQAIDLACEDNHHIVDLNTLTALHKKKTAKLIEASLLMAYLACDNPCPAKQALLSTAAMALGLYYQIQDDILDVTQSTETLGKPAGSDIDNQKCTYVSLLGLTKAKQAAEEILQTVKHTLETFFAPESNYHDTPLADIVALITRRKY